jgi:hypothetical protein
MGEPWDTDSNPFDSNRWHSDPRVTESQSFREFAQKWRNLVELRGAYFIALPKTGRWKQYYSEAEFPVVMREAVALAETWSKTTASCHLLRPIRW